MFIDCATVPLLRSKEDSRVASLLSASNEFRSERAVALRSIDISPHRVKFQPVFIKPESNCAPPPFALNQFFLIASAAVKLFLDRTQ